MAEDLLRRMNPGVKLDFQKPEARLVAFARTFYNHTARFAATKTNPDGSPSTVPVWIWDAKAEKLIKQEDVPIGNAEEYYGLRFARWALEKKPDYEPAQGIVLTLAAERAMERAHFGNLAIAEPATFRLLSDAPSTMLNDLLNFGINRKKTALVLAMLQVLGDRADRDAATPPAGTPPRPSLLVKAAQLPRPPSAVRRGRRLAPLAGAGAAGGSRTDRRNPPPRGRGRCRCAPRMPRARPFWPIRTSGVPTPSPSCCAGLGYNVEVFRTGRDLQRRIARASDFDLIFIDRHTPSPNLIDLISELRTDTRTAARPTFIIASTDKPRLPTFDQLLVRFAALIAATELQVLDVPPVYVFDARDSIAVNEKNQRLSMQKRDAALAPPWIIAWLGCGASSTRSACISPRPRRSSSICVLNSSRQGYWRSTTRSPRNRRQKWPSAVAQLREQIERQPPTPPYGVGVPTAELIKLIERFETDLLRVPEAQKRFEAIYAKVDPVGLGLPVERFRDPSLEAQLGRTLSNYPAVKIIPEPYGAFEIGEDLKAVYADPAQTPRDPATKKAAQRTAIEWLSKMATGARPGFEVKSAEPELRAALAIPYLTDAAIDGVAALGSALAQQDLLALALTGGMGGPTTAMRIKAADATIRHIQVNGKLIPKTLIDPLVEQSRTEADAQLRGKLLTLAGMLAYKQAEFVKDLQNFNPPLVNPAAEKEPAKEPKEPGKGPDQKQ